jgi:hypothetical protein
MQLASPFGQRSGESSIAIASDLADLSQLFEPERNVAVHRRQFVDELKPEIARVLAEPTFRLLTSVEPTATGLAQLAAELPAYPAIARELHFLCELLAELAGAESIGLRLARLESAMCPRFHVDHVLVRLVQTWSGVGTQYLDELDVDRAWLGHASAGAADEVTGLLRKGATIHTANAAELVLLKGESWPGNQGRGAVHRSPKASPAEPRLVLTLDPL